MAKLSTENIDLIPNPEALQNLCKSISALEAIISPEWEYRYYSYQKNWRINEEFCEMRNGQGDQMLILFTKDGVCINGFAHESKMNGWKRVSIEEKKSFSKRLWGSKEEPEIKRIQELNNSVIEKLPTVFHDFIFGEPVKSIGTTFCIWTIDKNWKTGEIEFPDDDYKDGSSDLLQLLDGKAMTYKRWAEEYYEEAFENRELNVEIVEKIYSHIPVTKELALEINPEIDDFESLKSDLNEIGFESKL